MGLLNLPFDVLEIIVEFLVATTTLRGGFRLREINSSFAQLVEREYMKRQADIYHPVKRPDMARKNAQALLYGRHRLSEAEVFSKIRGGLLESRLVRSGDLCYYLRKAVAVLMNTPTLRFLDIDGDGPVESEGFLEDHVDIASQARLLKIVDFITQAFICFAGIAEAAHIFLDFGTEPGIWFIRKCREPLEWAIFTAVFMERFSTVTALLAVFVPFDIDEDPERERARYYLAGVFGLAVKKCSCQMVSLLLQHGANVDHEVYRGLLDTALPIACQRGELAMVKLILDPRWGLSEGNDHNRTNRDKRYWIGNDPNHNRLAMNDRFCWIYRQSIQYAARCSCRNNGPQECDERILIINLLTNRTSVADLQDLRQGLLAEACTWGCMRITCMMLEAGACQNFMGYCKQPALVYVASHGHVKLMEYLLRCGAPHLSILFPPNYVHFVEEAANADMMMYFRNRDVTILKWGPLEITKAEFILKTAAEKNCVRVVKLLIRAGFDLREDGRGARALQNALFNNAVEVVGILKDYQG